MSFIDKYYQLIGIFLVLAILAGGGGIIWKNSKQIQNPKLEIQKETKPASDQKPAKININTASQEELESLPGVGKVKAKAIIDFREKYGTFKGKKDIIKVKGIGEKTFQKIEDLIEI